MAGGLSSGLEGALDPMQGFAVDRHHVEAAGRQAAEPQQVVLRRPHQTALLGSIHRRGRPSMGAGAARAHLDRGYRKPPNFADLARAIGTSQNKLKAVFKEAFGLTMADYCLDRRMREAQQLLVEAKLTIAQVAERVGYEHQSSFAAAFRGHVGMSPREYRRHRAPFSLEIPA